MPIGDSERTSGFPQPWCEIGRTAMSVEAPHTSKAASQSLVMLEAEARYASERYQLYRAKAYGSRPTSPGRLRELERASRLATARLKRAKADQRLPHP